MKNSNMKRMAVFPVLMMLVVTALALIGSSFAWFTVANTATVAQITTSSQTDGVRLEVSKDANRYTVRNVNVNEGAISSVLSGTLYQVSTTGLLKDRENTALTGLEFFNSSYSGYNATTQKEYIISKKDTSVTETAGKLAATPLDSQHANYGEQGDTYGEAYDAVAPTYIAFDLYFATDRKADLYLYAGTAIKAKVLGNNTQYTDNAEEASVLKALRLAVVYLGSTETATEVVTLNGSNGISANEQAQNSVTIWEVSGNDSVYGVNKTSYQAGNENADVEFYPYVNDEGAEGYVNTTAVTTYETSELIVTDKTNVEGKQKLFTTPAPSAETVERVYSKVRVYVWLEGQDPDCLSKVASQDIQINIVFFAKDASNN